MVVSSSLFSSNYETIYPIFISQLKLKCLCKIFIHSNDNEWRLSFWIFHKQNDYSRLLTPQPTSIQSLRSVNCRVAKCFSIDHGINCTCQTWFLPVHHSKINKYWLTNSLQLLTFYIETFWPPSSLHWKLSQLKIHAATILTCMNMVNRNFH